MIDRAALEPGAHVLSVNGMAQSYHVAGSGPVCIVHPGGPGAKWSYMRMPLLEASITMIYLEPIGTGASGRLRCDTAVDVGGGRRPRCVRVDLAS